MSDPTDRMPDDELDSLAYSRRDALADEASRAESDESDGRRPMPADPTPPGEPVPATYPDVYADDHTRFCALHDTVIQPGEGIWDDEHGERRGESCCGIPMRYPDGTLRATIAKEV